MTTDVAKVYGGALYDLAAEEGLEDELLTHQQTLTRVLAAEPQWLRLLAIPSIPKPERTALLDEALTGVHPYLVNFSKILCERESIGELPACFKEYRRRYNKAHGILTAVATAAVPMTEEQKARLTEKLAAATPALADLKADCLDTIAKSRRMKPEDVRPGFWGRLLSAVLRVFAPLM